MAAYKPPVSRDLFQSSGLEFIRKRQCASAIFPHVH